MKKRAIYRAFNNQVKNEIETYGKDISLNSYNVSKCSYCTIDPISGESTNINCTTCNGTGYYSVATTRSVKGVANTFMGNNQFILYGQEKYNIIPEGRARVTFLLDDILVDTHSVYGPTYLDSVQSIDFDGLEYNVKDYQRIGADELKVAVVTLSRVGKD